MHPSNALGILFTLDVLKLDKSNDVKNSLKPNMNSISVKEEVSNFVKSRDSKALHSKNIKFIFSTFAVLKLLKDIFFNFLH